MQKEIFKDIPDYEGSYQISNLGRVKSLNRLSIHNYGGLRKVNEIILKPYLDIYGYLSVGLSKEGKSKTNKIHILSAIVFKNHKPNKFNNLIVDHKDNIKTNNYEWNIQLITPRENSTKDLYRKNYSSKYIGVHWGNSHQRWIAKIVINKKSKYIGSFENEYQAHLAYQKELNQLNNQLWKLQEN